MMFKRRGERQQGSTTASCSSSSTTTTTTSGSLKSPLKYLNRYFKSSPSSEEKIDAARRKASERLKPKPFSKSKVDRLTELKAVKAESTLSTGHGNDGLEEKQPASSERDDGMTRHGIIFSGSLMVYTMIQILHLNQTIQSSGYQTFADVCLLFLQASSLRSLLYIFSLLAFDAIKFGHSDALIKGRRLYVSQVSKFTFLISVAIVLASLIVVAAALFFQKAACFIIQGESDSTVQSSRISDKMANLGSEDASMRAVLEYLMIIATIVLKTAWTVIQRLLPRLELMNFAAVCEKSLPSSLSSHLVHGTLSLSTYFMTRFAVFCVAAFGIAKVLLPK